MDAALRSRRIAVLAASGLAVAGIAFSVGASAGTTPGSAASCRASVARVGLAGSTVLEPFIANDANAPCKAEDAGVINPTTSVGPIDLRVLYASTHTTAPQAEAGVAHVLVHLDGTHDISARVAESQASVACNGTTPVLSGKSEVLGLTIGGTPIDISDGGTQQTVIPADPLITVTINEQTVSGTSPNQVLTQRAIHIVALAQNLDIVIGESQVDSDASSCGGGTTGATTGNTTGNSTGSTTGSPPPPCTMPPAADTSGTGNLPGYMTGGGSVTNGTNSCVNPGNKVSHGFVLPCQVGQSVPGGENLNLNGDFGHFKLDTVTSADCINVVSVGSPKNPQAGFNTLKGSGTGTCAGKPTNATWIFTDTGEPNQHDRFEVHLTGGCVLDVESTNWNGNNQAHPASNGQAHSH